MTTAPKFVTLPSISQIEGWQRSLVLSALVRSIRSRLGVGEHAYNSLDDMFGAIGIEHVTHAGLVCRNCPLPSLQAQDGTLWQMSYGEFRRVVNRTPSVRLVTNSPWRVDLYGVSPYVLIVS